MDTKGAKVDGLFHQYGLGRMYRTKQAFLDDFGKILTDNELESEYLEEDDVIFVSFEMLKETVHVLHCKSTPTMFEALASPFIGSSSSKSMVKKLLYKVMDKKDLKLVQEVPKRVSPVVYGGSAKTSKSWALDATMDNDEIDGLYFPPHPLKYSVEKLKLPMKRVAGADSDDDGEDDGDKFVQSPEVIRKSRAKKPKQLTPKQEQSNVDEEDYGHHSLISSPDMSTEANKVAAIFDLIENWDDWSQRTYPNTILQDYIKQLGIYIYHCRSMSVYVFVCFELSTVISTHNFSV